MKMICCIYNMKKENPKIQIIERKIFKESKNTRN